MIIFFNNYYNNNDKDHDHDHDHDNDNNDDDINYKQLYLSVKPCGYE